MSTLFAVLTFANTIYVADSQVSISNPGLMTELWHHTPTYKSPPAYSIIM